MSIRRLRTLFPAGLLLASIGLHFVTMVLYTRMPTSFAAFTTFPIWVWGSVGLLASCSAFLFFRTRFSMLVTCIWTFTIFLMADEAKALGRFSAPTIEEGPAGTHHESPVLRVITLNCALRTDPYEAVKDYHPDVIFLQELPHAYILKRLIDQLYQGQGDYRYDRRRSCGIIVRGKIKSSLLVPKYRSQLVTVETNSGKHLELLNVHLQQATTNLRLWKRSCWHQHSNNRRQRLVELHYALETLKQKTAFPRLPAIVAGDFNASANDPVYELLRPEFTDAFSTVGTGWGNTYHRSLPLLRIDCIYSSDKLIPLRSRAIKLPLSDHRMVVADYIFR